MRVLVAMSASLALAAAPPGPATSPSRDPSPSRTEMRVYDLGLTDVALAADVVRSVLSTEGRVYPDPAQHRLVVSDRPDVHARVAQALATLHVEPRNVVIDVTARLERTDSERRIEGAVRTGGPVDVILGHPLPAPGVAVTAQDRRGREDVHASQRLVVLSGGRATLTVAEEVPYAQWLFDWGVGHGLWAQTVAWQQVGTSLVVEPRVLGDGAIHVRLTPRFDYRAGGDPRTVDVNELSTEVVVRPGEEVALGGVPFRDEEFRERFLVGVDQSGQTARVAMTLRASVQ
jgi:type II secretory pathway component GspD/PulD (secretin)